MINDATRAGYEQIAARDEGQGKGSHGKHSHHDSSWDGAPLGGSPLALVQAAQVRITGPPDGSGGSVAGEAEEPGVLDLT